MYTMNTGLMNQMTFVFESVWWDIGGHRIDWLTSDNANEPFFEIYHMIYIYERPAIVVFSSGDAAAKVNN